MDRYLLPFAFFLIAAMSLFNYCETQIRSKQIEIINTQIRILMERY
jgi:hypothetical protein